ncbi:SRPBCC family protein [Mucilaginibacter agri]|uniref:SRPBCC domain-containing protein n=1 Tax=Mucilaginibacter agri TaxID=2695265 RepID=A0A966DUB1_9SPHI|nr:SRPBCC domain-containing protein [Mucilaginibacter agri]NCD70256.1 SRPBCC domain-containing protein [Mucilaginibacter agri]
MTNMIFEKDLAAKKIHVVREFNAPVEKVWRAWTEPALLEKWWGPKPWVAKTKSMDFTVGGAWLYAMEGPEGQKHWSYVKFTTIEKESKFATDAMFSDEEGNTLPGAPVSHWDNKFMAEGNKTKVVIDLSFDNDADIKMLVEMGFEGGFTIGLNQLEELLAIEQA